MANFTSLAPWPLSGPLVSPFTEVLTISDWPSYHSVINQTLTFRGIQVKVWNPETSLWELAPTGV